MHEQLEQAGWKQRNAVGLMERIGPLWARREGDGWAYGLIADDGHINNAGIVHGGVMTTLADHALSILAWEAVGRQPCVTLQLDTYFMAASKPGDFIEVRGQISHQTRSTLFLDGILSVGEEPVARASGIWRLAPSQRGGKATDKRDGG